MKELWGEKGVKTLAGDCGQSRQRFFFPQDPGKIWNLLLSFYLGLESNKEVGASFVEMIFNIHFEPKSLRYNFIEHIVHWMQEKLLLSNVDIKDKFN